MPSQESQRVREEQVSSITIDSLWSMRAWRKRHVKVISVHGEWIAYRNSKGEKKETTREVFLYVFRKIQ